MGGPHNRIGVGVDDRVQKTVLPIGAEHVASTGLRATVEKSENLRLISEVEPGPNAIAAAAERHPNHILVAADGLNDEVMVLLRALDAASPRSDMVMCADEKDAGDIEAAMRVPLEGIVAWQDVTADNLGQTLEFTTHGAQVMSPAIGAAWLESGESRPQASELSVPLTGREGAVLHAMGTVDRQKDVPASMHMADRTVHDVIASLKRKLNVRSPFMLGAWGHALGLVLLDDPNE